MVVDADDDVEPLLEALGEEDEAAAYGRLAREWLPRADVVTAASAVDARAISERYAIAPVLPVPNSVRRPPRITPRPDRDRVLFVGNLTYPPNVAAARDLALDVFPALRARRPDATLHLVGHAAPLVRELDALDGVTVHGFAPDLAPHYGAADVVVAPCASGAGTRIKVLEAFAYERPVVATPIAVSGLEVRDEHEVLLADTAAGLAVAVERVLTDATLADRLTAAASATLDDRYAPDVVAPMARHGSVGRTSRSRG